jgi:hypothetical protein
MIKITDGLVVSSEVNLSDAKVTVGLGLEDVVLGLDRPVQLFLKKNYFCYFFASNKTQLFHGGNL